MRHRSRQAAVLTEVHMTRPRVAAGCSGEWSWTRNVPISGFGKEEVKKYITEYFASSNLSAGEKLLSTLSLRPHIERLCYVPLLLLMVCYIVSFDGDSAELVSLL